MADLVQNDVGTMLIVTCYDQNGDVIDLTSASSISLQYYIDSFPPVYIRPMTVVGKPVNGIVQYVFGTYTDANGVKQYDLGQYGTLYFRVIITNPVVKGVSPVFSSFGCGEITVHKSLTPYQ